LRPLNLRNPAVIGLALLGTTPAIILGVLRLADAGNVSDGTASILYGVSILSAAFLLTWAAEAAEHDISHALALSSIAVITVLPEYAVDFTLVWKAGDDPQYAQYAVANMTGANRLLIGLAWPLVVLIIWAKHKRRGVRLARSQNVELGFLAAATIYAFTLPLKGHIDLFDAVVFIGLFVGYMWFNARSEVREPDLIGPSALIGALGTAQRRAVVLVLFVFAAAVIFLSAEPFAEGLIATGKTMGFDEFLLIQWVAPLASEAPEILVASIFAFRGDGASALGMLISAKVNQWTLLIGSLPVVYAISTSSLSSLPLDGRQTEEVLLTAAQSLFAVAILVTLFLSARVSLVLLVMFLTQLFVPETTFRLAFSGLYLAVAAAFLVGNRERLRSMVRLPRSTLQAGGLLGGLPDSDETDQEPETVP
jgi:cation:H+ antiporter